MKNKGYLISAVIFFFLFLIVSLMTSGTQGMLLDEEVGYWATQFEGSTFEKMMKLISIFGSTSVILLLTVVIGLVLLVKRKWKNFFFFFVLSLGGVILNFVMKMLVKRERPGDETSNIEVFNITFDIPSYSFPSGHTMRATIFFLFLVFLVVRYAARISVKSLLTLIFVVMIGLVALSRIILDAHYVTDIIGAIVLSVGWFFLCGFFFIRPKENDNYFYLNR